MKGPSRLYPILDEQVPTCQHRRREGWGSEEPKHIERQRQREAAIPWGMGQCWHMQPAWMFLDIAHPEASLLDLCPRPGAPAGYAHQALHPLQRHADPAAKALSRR